MRGRVSILTSDNLKKKCIGDCIVKHQRQQWMSCGCVGFKLLIASALAFTGPGLLVAGDKGARMNKHIEIVLRETQPLTHPRGNRLPLYVWAVLNVHGEDAEIENMLKALDQRGIAACATWRPGRDRAKTLDQALRIGVIQKRLGLRVNINANACTYSVFNGSVKTAHIDADGNAFFDTSSSKQRKLGCPFAVRHRYPAMREQIDYYLRAYKEKDIPVDFVFADWEIDGPIEWNEGWSSAKRCVRCCNRIAKIDDFPTFQKAYRDVRSEIQRECYAGPVLKHFPKALVGNYGVYPHNGWRYWYDHFEKPPPKGVPVQTDQRAIYRPWPQEFEACGYTFAMPVVYTRRDIWGWYDWKNGDFRWFYNLLLQVSSVGKNTSAKTPIISFVNFTSCSKPRSSSDPIKPMSEKAYTELLWHMLLRGHDAFFLWCPSADITRELRPLHKVFSASLEYREFLDKGVPVTFGIPKRPGPVVSGLRLGKRVLVRRSDFTSAQKPVPLRVGKILLQVPRAEGQCQILDLL